MILKQFYLFILIALFFYACEKKRTIQKPNVLLICIDDLRPELKSFGADYIISPNIDELAQKGTAFTKHFVNAPSCGPSRYSLLTGQYGPATNDALFQRAKKIITQSEEIKPSMPEWFKIHGYTTVSVGKVSHHPGGRGGKDWNDSTALEMPKAWDRHLMPVAEWIHPRGTMHGLAHGEIRINANEMDVFQSAEGNDNIYPDGIITETALEQLKDLTSNSETPFFFAVGIIKPHLPFGAPKLYLDLYNGVELPPIAYPQKPEGKTTWHESKEFMKYNRWGKDPNTDKDFAEEIRRHYAASVSYADAQVGRILSELKRTGADKNTIVVLWGDHGWHLGEQAIWGKHSLFEESLHSPLIIYNPTKEDISIKSNHVVQTLDIFPTLCDLAGIQIPEYVHGKSFTQMFENSDSSNHYALAYTDNAKTIRTKTHRLILHNDGFVELYSHILTENNNDNVAYEYPQLVKKLKEILINNLR